MKMKKYFKLIIIIFAVMIFELQIQPDDKELFMGLNVDSSLVRPNMMILVDNSASMNDVLYFPKKGFDGVAGTEDDGYAPNTPYTGVFDSGIDPYIGSGEFGNDYPGHYTLNETRWVARWIVDGAAMKYATGGDGQNPNWTGCYQDDGTPYRFRVGSNGLAYFKEGDLVMYQNKNAPYNAALAIIVIKENLADGTGSWITLAYDAAADPLNLDPTVSIVGGKIVPNADNNLARFQRVPDNATWQAVIIKLYGVREIWGGEGGEGKCQYHDAGYPENYLKWMFLHAADDQRKAINHFSTYATFDTLTTIPTGYDVDEDGDGIVMSEGDIVSSFPSWCYKETGQVKYMTYLWTRIQVTREVLCWLARQHSQRIMLGLAEFQEPPKIDYCGSSGGEAGFDPAGAESPVLDGLGDMSETNSLTDFLNNTYGIKANSETPLAEALADVWYYYKPGPQNKTYWPVSYELENGPTSTTNAVSDIKYWCQNNYVVLMTDGVSTKDDFKADTTDPDDPALYQYANSIFTSNDYLVKHDEESWLYNNPKEYERWRFGWGDTDSNDPTTDNTTLYCPNETCWDTARLGTDYLDDVAYFLRHQDMYPDDDKNKKYFRTTIDPDKPNEPIWPDDQSIFTYVIGFNADNDMLRETAQNGDGGYFTADTFKELKEAFANVIVSINLRNFAFSSITAPKKTATAQNEEQTVSYVGYFLPSGDSLWEGHLLSFKLEDKWGWDSDNDGSVEYIHASQEDCLTASGGIPCQRSVALSTDQQWDAALRMPTIRNLYTHDESTLIDFNISENNKIKDLFETNLSIKDVNQIIATIRDSRLGDIFHSDVGFVGPPPFGKQFLSNINPLGTDDELYTDFYQANKDRSRVLYVGTNDGIMHMIYADDEQNRSNPAGEEVWGFIPDEVLPSLEKIVLDDTPKHTYTVDGRLTANDIYYVKSGQGNNTWSTILLFGLRRGGRAFYALDITNINTQPTLLWKFKDDDHSGQSWGKPAIGRIKIQDPDNASQIIDQWVAVLPGGFEFNSDNPNDTKGKAIFVVNAATGQLIWKVAYTMGEPDDPDPESGLLNDNSTDSNKFLTTVNVFNYPIPSAVLTVDKDGNGFLDTIYFGNLGGHLFKANISDTNPNNWTTQLIFEDQYIPQIGPVAITDIVEDIEEISGKKFKITLNINQSPFAEGDTIMGTTSYASGYITYQDKNVITVKMNSGTFIFNDAFKEEVVSYTYDPIYMIPAAAFDTCYQLWLTFGTGDRDRPRSYPHGGKFVIFRDNGFVNNIYDPDPTDPSTISSTLAQFTWKNGVFTPPSPIPSDVNGLFFYFPDTGERLFEPEPIILPDENVIPHIYFNTYQPPPAVPTNKDDPCDLPAEGVMKLYDISLNNCGTLETIEAERETGRIAGGGIYAGKEYVMYKSKSGDVADVPGGEGGQFITDVKRLPYPGGLLFWKEKKR